METRIRIAQRLYSLILKPRRQSLQMKMFFTSPRNSVVAHESLFKQLNCTKFLAPTPRPPPVTAILDAFKMDVLEVPSVDELLNTPHPHFEFSKTYPEAAKERMVVV